MTIAALADRVGLRIEEQTDDPALPRFLAREPGDDPRLSFDDAGETIAAHLRRNPWDGYWLLDWMSRRPATGVSAIIEGHRRWWVGSLAHTLAGCGFRSDPAVGPCFARLRALVGDQGTACDWFDALAPAPDPLFDLSRGARDPDLSIGEIGAASLRPLLDAASALDRFEPPPGPIGLAPARDDIGEWTRWTRGNVAALARVGAAAHLVSILV